jgi:hypothetical protein
MKHASILRLAVVVSIVGLSAAAAAPVCHALTRQRGVVNRAPKLLEPHESLTVPADGSPARFRWNMAGMRGDSHQFDQFRVFKGNQAYADAMVHEQRVEPGTGAAEVPASVFAEPGTYCWTVRQVGSRDKSREAFSVFKVGGTS